MGLQPSLKAAFLDFDGTLVRLPVDWQGVREEIPRLFHPWGLSPGLRPLYPGLREAFLALKEAGVSAGARGWLRRRVYAALTRAELAAAPGAAASPGSRDLLRTLASRGWNTAIQTTLSVRTVEEVSRRLRLPPVDAVVGRESARELKPHPQGVRSVLRRWGLRGWEVVVIGDSDYDVEVGRAVGATTVRVGNQKSGEPESCIPDWAIPSLAEVLAFLSGLRVEQTT